MYKKIKQLFINIFTKNYCDTCGFTNEKVFVTEYFCEGGLIQCNKCIDNTKQ